MNGTIASVHTTSKYSVQTMSKHVIVMFSTVLSQFVIHPTAQFRQFRFLQLLLVAAAVTFSAEETECCVKCISEKLNP